MKTIETKNTGHYKIANAAAIVLIVFLGVSTILETARLGLDISLRSTIGFSAIAALILLVPVFRSTKFFPRLAFYTPLILLGVTTLIMILSNVSSYYLFACFCICGISCLYANFSLTLGYIMIQAVAIGLLLFLGVPIVGAGNSSIVQTIICVIFLLFCGLLLILARTVTVELNTALNDGNSFRTFLSTTANYLAMVDRSNEVVYVSQPLSKLAGIENPELTKGRSFIDLFPGRELKLLASRMLGRRELYEEDWEFVLNGQKRFFKAASDTFTGTSKGTLINLHDMTYLAERDEIAAMRDSLKIGLFFINRECIIQDNYSRHLEELLSRKELNGKLFLDLLTESVTPKELDAIRDYFDMVFDRLFDQMTLDDINPLHELHYISAESPLEKKIFQCEFTPVERGKGEVFVLAAIYDITAKVELQQRLLEEEAKRQEEMRSIFELIQVDPNVFSDFQEDAEYEFVRIDETLKNEKMTPHEILVEVYQSVHAIKSNAVILGLNTFGNKVHELESKIKKLREQVKEVTFDEMLRLTMELEKLSSEKDNFKAIIDKINSFKAGTEGGQKQNEYVLIETLTKTTNKAAADMGKLIKFEVVGIDSDAIEKGPRRLMKEVLMQLIRNSVVHGVETPDERVAKGKDETGSIRLSIKTNGKVIQVKLADDGGGFNFDKIRAKALSLNLIKPEDANNKDVLLEAIYLPGFSTAETEGVHAGRGIGLNLVRDRVRDAKGTIKTQSEFGKGTVFTILLPVTDNAEAAKTDDALKEKAS